MGKANGRVKRAKTFKHHVDRKRLWKKSKQLPVIKCAEIKAAWNPKKTVDANMRLMGLALDANKTMKIDDTKDQMIPRKRKASKNTVSEDVSMEEPNVADLLEKEAATPTISLLKLSEPEAQFCMQMMRKHGEDYKAMAKDAGNYYQETPKAIQRKINKFRKYPGHHGDFLKSLDSSVMDAE
ncbi:putative Nucleolar protein 16 [Hypsibius exemplaris]|uniref:Nucleolar protein 16 n=1 Tax=Hypsibius exemplaris TaxID=2072580 RepID=A0A1W0WN79_HYPEX|nr:putative Nucleolar protein 16 [Hypsibius exemplaris]